MKINKVELTGVLNVALETKYVSNSLSFFLTMKITTYRAPSNFSIFKNTSEVRFNSLL